MIQRETKCQDLAHGRKLNDLNAPKENKDLAQYELYEDLAHVSTRGEGEGKFYIWEASNPSPTAFYTDGKNHNGLLRPQGKQNETKAKHKTNRREKKGLQI